MKLANIVYQNELINHTKVDYVNYFNEPKRFNKLDYTLPTLYVGWSFMKKCNPDSQIIQNADILDKNIISNNLFWEFDFKENKQSHVNGVKEFVENIPEYYYKPKYKYINLDPVFFQVVDIDELMCILPNEIDKAYQFKDEIVYTLCGDSITGINLKMYEFFQFNVSEILNKIASRCKNKNSVFHDVDGEMFMKYYKIFPEYTLLKRYIVVNL